MATVFGVFLEFAVSAAVTRRNVSNPSAKFSRQASGVPAFGGCLRNARQSRGVSVLPQIRPLSDRIWLCGLTVF